MHAHRAQTPPKIWLGHDLDRGHRGACAHLTKDLHRGTARYEAAITAQERADELGRVLLGRPSIEGDLGGTQVHLVWLAVAQPAAGADGDKNGDVR
jgi:hypothetical protein